MGNNEQRHRKRNLMEENKYKLMTEQLRLTNSDEEVGNYLRWIIASDMAKEYWENELKNKGSNVNGNTPDTNKYKDKKTRPLSFGELCIILARFEIMLTDGPDKYTIEEFIQQEDYRRDLFTK